MFSKRDKILTSNFELDYLLKGRSFPSSTNDGNSGRTIFEESLKEINLTKIIEFKVNSKTKLIFDPYRLSQNEIIQKTLLKYKTIIKQKGEDIYNLCKGLVKVNINSSNITNKNEIFQIFLETEFNETLEQIDLESLSLIQKMKILVEIAAKMSDIHREKIFGID